MDKDNKFYDNAQNLDDETELMDSSLEDIDVTQEEEPRLLQGSDEEQGDKFSIQNREKAESFKDELREQAELNRQEVVSAYKDKIRNPLAEDDKKYLQAVNVANRAGVEAFKNNLREEVAKKQQQKEKERQDAIDRVNRPLIMCPDCGLMIVSDVTNCPECGWKNTNARTSVAFEETASERMEGKPASDVVAQLQLEMKKNQQMIVWLQEENEELQKKIDSLTKQA